MITRSPLTLTACILALATLLITIIMLFLMPAHAALSEGFYTPIIAFEFAQSNQDLLFLAGNAGANNRQGMHSGLLWDMAFPFAYAGFLCVLIGSHLNKHPRIATLGLLFSLLTIPADIYENWVLLSILDALSQASSTETLLAQLHIATWLKWGSMGLGFAALAVIDIQVRKPAAIFVSLFASLSVLLCFLSGSKPITTELMMLCFTLFYAVHIPRVFYQTIKLKRETAAS